MTNVSLAVTAGVVWGLVGENGAAKTTLIKPPLGLLKPQSGRVPVFGRDTVADPIGVLGRIGYLSETHDMPDWMRVGELMQYMRAFFPKWDDGFAAELRETFELARDQRVRSLSRGQRARAGLLIALSHRPKLLVLDEPSSGLDPVVRRDILTALIRTVADEGRTVLFSSHLLDEVERVADHVAVLHQGRLLLSDPLDQLLESHLAVTLRFAEPQDQLAALRGGIGWSGDGREWTCISNGELEALRGAARAAGAEIVEERRPSLEEVFVARGGGT